MPKDESLSEGNTETYDSNFQMIRDISKCKVQILDNTLELVIDTGSQISAISETVFKKYFQKQTLLQSSFVNLADANGVIIPYFGHLVCNLKIHNTVILNCVIYVLKNLVETEEKKQEHCILGTNILASVPGFQNLLKSDFSSNEQPTVNDNEMYICGEKTYLPKNSVYMIQVRSRTGVKSEEEVMLETYKNLQEKMYTL